MRIGFVIPSRLKSSRLKKKILMNLGGQSALEWAIDRAKASNSIDEVVIATTPLSSDAEVTKICVKKGVRYFQGSPEDVLLRLRDTAEYFDFDYVVNITPDNTLFSVYLIDLMVSAIKEDPSADFVRFDDAMFGTGIYALKKEALQTVCEFKTVFDTEIWGPLFQEEYFKVKALAIPSFLKANYRLTMDTEADYLMLSQVFEKLEIVPGKIVELDQVIRFLDSHPDVAAINTDVIQQMVPQEQIESIKTNFKEKEELFYSIRSKYYKGEC